MTPNEMLTSCQQWTKVVDQTKRLIALRKAYNWAVRRVFNSENGPDLLASIGEEMSALVATTKTYSLGTHVAHPILSIKKLWVKLPSDAKFVSMEPMDTADERFTDGDADLAANTQVAQGHPVYFDIINFSQARFAPALPAGAIIRVDYFRLARDLGVPESGDTESHELNEVPVVGEDLPSVFDDAVTSMAISFLFNMLDDDREGTWAATAMSELNDALFIGKRTQGPTQTQPFRRRRRRFI